MPPLFDEEPPEAEPLEEEPPDAELLDEEPPEAEPPEAEPPDEEPLEAEPLEEEPLEAEPLEDDPPEEGPSPPLSPSPPLDEPVFPPPLPGIVGGGGGSGRFPLSTCGDRSVSSWQCPCRESVINTGADQEFSAEGICTLTVNIVSSIVTGSGDTNTSAPLMFSRSRYAFAASRASWAVAPGAMAFLAPTYAAWSAMWCSMATRDNSIPPKMTNANTVKQSAISTAAAAWRVRARRVRS